MNMTSRIQLTIRIAAALAATSAALPSQAQSHRESCLGNPKFTPAFFLDYAASRPGYANGCIRDIAGGRAAVLLPSALETTDGLPVDRSTAPHAWGFLDEKGRVAIRPIFEAVSDFRHGLAAVRWQGKWGFIDKNGRMAVRPRFDTLEDMTEVGLAVALLDGRLLLIDRQGNAVGSPFEEVVYSVHISDGVPARATIDYLPEHRSVTGERHYGGRGIIEERPLGKNGLYVASNRHGTYGVIDDDWNWIVQPVYRRLDVRHADGPAVGYGPEGWVMVTAQGKLIGADHRYTSMNLVGSAFWSATLRDGSGHAVLNGDGVEVATLTPQDAETSQLYTDTILYVAGGNTMALVPGQAAPIALGQDVRVSLVEDGFLLLVDSNESNAGLLTPTGAWLQAGSGADWVPQVHSVSMRHDRLWLFDAQNKLLTVVDKDGKTLFSPPAVKAAQTMRVKSFPAIAPDAPLAIVKSMPDSCQCEGSGNGVGLILGDGSLVMNPSWIELIVLRDEEDDNATHGGPFPLRYAASTATGMVLLDERGNPLDLQEQQHIGMFRHGYAPIYGNGVARMIDINGNAYDLPESFDAQVVGPGVARYLKTSAHGEPWGLYDFVAGKELAAPQFRSIADFRDGQAVASLGTDRLGVIDLQGKWVVPPTHRSARRVNANLWLISRVDDVPDERFAAFFNSDGRALTSFEPRLDVTRSRSGAIDAGNGRQGWIISSDGSSAIDMQDASFFHKGNWMTVIRGRRQGFLDGQGNWQIAPSPASVTPFQGSPARALRLDGKTTHVMDASGNTLATLAGDQWRWPPGSAWLLRHTWTDGWKTTNYADLNGKTVLSVEGHASGFSGGRAVTDLPDDGQRAVDLKGKVNGPAFRELGAQREGLAPAYADGGYGFVGHNGQFVIPAQYQVVSGFTNRRAVVSTANESRIIDPTGRALAYVQNQCGVRTLHGASGQRLWPVRMPQGCKPPSPSASRVEK